jgi:phosphatidylserine/phosphatidylglycerophosphate/cardiolipin synthase-like enzyme
VEDLRREAIRLGKLLKVYTADVPVGSLLHAKLVIADGKSLILGSANITWPGLEQNLEAGAVLNNGEANEAKLVISGLEKAGLVRLIFVTGIEAK